MGADIFRTFKEGKPDLVDLGIKPVRRAIGGMFPGNIVVIGAGQNTGKSSLALEMLCESHDPGAILSLEDGEDVLGVRLLAKYSDVPPALIRKKDLTAAQTERIRRALERLKAMDEAGELRGRTEVAVGASKDRIEELVGELAAEGARWCGLDYLQKVRGHHAERRCEVGETMVTFQRACKANNMVPVIWSQLVRLPPGQEPYPGHLKESGDIENEARLIILLWRDADDLLTLHGKMAKSSFGAGGTRFKYYFTPAEYLTEERPAMEDDL